MSPHEVAVATVLQLKEQNKDMSHKERAEFLLELILIRLLTRDVAEVQAQAQAKGENDA